MYMDLSLTIDNAKLYAALLTNRDVVSAIKYVIDGIDAIDVTLACGEIVTCWIQCGKLYGEW